MRVSSGPVCVATTGRAVGACAVDGGLFTGSYAVAGGVKDVIAVDLHIPGCPPNPRALLAGLLALLQTAA